MQSTLRFIAGFLQHPIRNSIPFPSSPYLCRNMIAGLDFENIHTIIELGAGTGVITKEIVRNAKLGTKIITVEIDEQYNVFLKEQFGDRVIVETASCSDFDTILAKHGIDVPDLIVSGLPFPTIPKEISHKTIDLIKQYTARGAKYRMFTYAWTDPFPWSVPSMFADQRLTKRSLTFVNFPPAYVYGIN